MKSPLRCCGSAAEVDSQTPGKSTKQQQQLPHKRAESMWGCGTGSEDSNCFSLLSLSLHCKIAGSAGQAELKQVFKPFLPQNFYFEKILVTLLSAGERKKGTLTHCKHKGSNPTVQMTGIPLRADGWIKKGKHWCAGTDTNKWAESQRAKQRFYTALQQDGLMDALQERCCLLTWTSNDLLNKIYLSHSACGVLRMTKISKETVN